VALVRPHVAIVTTVAPVHLEYFGTTAKIAEAKAEIFSGLVAGGTAIINGDLSETQILIDAAKETGAEIVVFGRPQERDVRWVWADLHPDGSKVLASVRGEKVTYRIGAPGKHLVENSLAVLAAVVAAGASLEQAAASLAKLEQPKGRGSLVRLRLAGGEALLIDESYNANPASMRAALELLGQVGEGARRVAVLGDMLELGPEGPALHANIAELIAAAHVDRVFLAGPLMEHLWHALPSAKRGGYARTSAMLQQVLIDQVAAGDTIMVKGSNGIRMGQLIDALKAAFQ
jgi:UDP-N-acetylmuramyl pentapeptide synthase